MLVSRNGLQRVVREQTVRGGRGRRKSVRYFPHVPDQYGGLPV